MALAAALALLVARPPSGDADLQLTLVAGLLTVAGRSITFRISAAGITHMGTPALLVCVLLLEPSLAVLVGAAATAISDGFIRRGSRSPAFNTGQVIVQSLILLSVLELVGWNPAAPAFGSMATIGAIMLGGMLAIAASALMVSVLASFTRQRRFRMLFWEMLTGGDGGIHLIDLSKICIGLITAMILFWAPIYLFLILIPVATMSHAIARGITFQKRLERALQETEHSLAEAQRLARLGSWEWEIASRRMRWSDQTYEMAGVDPGAADVSMSMLNSLLRKPDRLQLNEIVSDLVESHGTAAFDHEIVRPDGSVRFVHHVLAWAQANERSGERLVGTVLDITDRKRLELELRHQAYHDGLTGLPNRELFLERLGDCLAAGLDRDAKTAVIFLDIDYFKGVNDRFGHEAGDSVLIEVARRLERTISPCDTAARLSGDEFTVLAHDDRGDDRIKVLANRLLTVLQQPVQVCGQTIPVGASAGLVYINGHHQTPSDVLSEADDALYRAKDAGRGRICSDRHPGELVVPAMLREPA